MNNSVAMIFDNRTNKHIPCPSCRRSYGHLEDCPLMALVNKVIQLGIEGKLRELVQIKNIVEPNAAEKVTGLDPVDGSKF
jgi:hypothetical protein